MNDFYVFFSEEELYHHGIKGMKWGVRRYQNPDGSLTPRGIKRYNKVKNTNSPSYLYKNRKVLSEDDYEKAYNRIKRDADLRYMKSREDEIKAKKMKSALKVATAAAAVGGYLYLTKTESGRALVDQGKNYVKESIKNAAVDVVKTASASTVSAGKQTVDSVVKASKDAANSAKERVSDAYQEERKSSAKKFKESVKSGDSAASALYNYGKKVDEALEKNKNRSKTRSGSNRSHGSARNSSSIKKRTKR